MSRRVAFLTMENVDGYALDDHLAIEPLRALSFETTFVPWTGPVVDWSRYQAVVLRSTFDYVAAPERFLTTLAAIEASSARLANPLAVVRWNLSKRYLRDLQDADVRVVPTVFGEKMSRSLVADLFRRFGTEEVIVKPLVGASGAGVCRITPDASERELDALIERYRDRLFLAQPFVPRILDDGECSLFFFAEEYSHAVRKTPRPGRFLVQEEHGGTTSTVEPAGAMIELARAALRAVPREGGALPLLYARVDIVRLEDGEAAVMELELIEPQLFLGFDPDAPRRFARAIAEWIRPVASA